MVFSYSFSTVTYPIIWITLKLRFDLNLIAPFLIILTKWGLINTAADLISWFLSDLILFRLFIFPSIQCFLGLLFFRHFCVLCVDVCLFFIYFSLLQKNHVIYSWIVMKLKVNIGFWILLYAVFILHQTWQMIFVFHHFTLQFKVGFVGTYV